MEKPINCTVKAPVLQRVGDSKVDFHTGCSIIDVTFHNVFYVEVQDIHFKNYYTAAVTLLAKFKPQANAAATADKQEKPWKLCVNKFPLMPHPHTDQGAEDYFTIGQRQLGGPLHNITALRFILHQPSPVWKEFYIDDLKLYKNSTLAPPEVPIPTWVTDTESEDTIDRQLKGVTSVTQLSRDLQSLWALTVQAGQQQTDSSLGRYDVEGSYEINLLSYT